MYILNPSLIITPSADLDTRLPVIGWHNVVTVATIAATSEDADHPVTELANQITYLYWLSASTGTQYLTATLSGVDEVDYVAIARHNLGSAGVTVSVEANIGAGWVEVFPAYLPADDKPLLLRFTGVASPTGVRVKLVPDGTEPSAAVLYIGKLLVMERGVQPGHTPLPYALSRNIVSGRSVSGEYLGRIEHGAALKSSANFRFLTADFVREELNPFLEDGGPFFFVWQPEEYPDEVGYAWCANDPIPTISHLSNFSDVTLELEALAL